MVLDYITKIESEEWVLTKPIVVSVRNADGGIDLVDYLPGSVRGPPPKRAIIFGSGIDRETAERNFGTKLIEHYEKLRKKEELELTCSETLQLNYLSGLLERV